jgi:superfamily II DNA helicase RecQ
MQNEDHVVVIIGTGAGKSVLFMLPAMVSSRLTIIIEPLTALRFDMKAQYNKLGIISTEWDSRRPYIIIQIIFITPKAAIGEAFRHFINHKRTVGRLDQFVLNKCHTPLDSIKGFRPQLLALAELGKVGVQIVYLTATLRPQEEPQFIKLIGLPDKSKCS